MFGNREGNTVKYPMDYFQVVVGVLYFCFNELKNFNKLDF